MNKLNIGCGKRKRKDCINIDKEQVDLNKFPYPFKDNTFSHIYANNVLEHLDNLIDVFNELYRISKDNTIIEVTSPFWLHPTSNNMTHTKNNVSVDWFKPILDNNPDGERFRYQEIKGKFNLIRYEYIPSIKLPNFFVNRFANLIPCLVVAIKHYIKVKKPTQIKTIQKD